MTSAAVEGNLLGQHELPRRSLVWTAVGLLVQADILQASANVAQRRALAWHAYLWDPWFLIWGLLAGFALWLGRDRGTGR